MVRGGICLEILFLYPLYDTFLRLALPSRASDHINHFTNLRIGAHLYNLALGTPIIMWGHCNENDAMS